eukprot:3328669-Rhodomonas_salina.1
MHLLFPPCTRPRSSSSPPSSSSRVARLATAVCRGRGGVEERVEGVREEPRGVARRGAQDDPSQLRPRRSSWKSAKSHVC